MKFGTTIIDPPWPYERVSTHKRLSGYSYQHYQPLSLEALANLPVGKITMGVLLLWTTAPMVPAALKLIDSWDFEYITQLFWLKTLRVAERPYDGQGEAWQLDVVPSYGVGYWVRGNVEPIIVAKKPGTPSYRTNATAAFVANRQKHSAKPDTLYRLAEEYFPGPYLDIFARQRRPGWVSLGDALLGEGSGDIAESMPALLARSDISPTDLAHLGQTDQERLEQAPPLFTEHPSHLERRNL